MSSGVLNLNNSNQKRSKLKREYSKGGCRECKRRKIKCSEDKPQCWQCGRLKKECSYPAVGEKVLRASRKVLAQYPHGMIDKSSKHLTIQQYDPEGGHMKKKIKQSGSSSIQLTSLQGLPSHINESPSTTTVDSVKASPVLVPNTKNNVPATSQNGSPTNLPSRYTTSSIVSLLNDANSPLLPAQSYQTEVKPNPSPTSISSHIHSSPHLGVFNGSQNSYLNKGQTNFTTSNDNITMSNDNLLLLNNDYPFYDQGDLNILATDLNNLVSNIMFESNFDSKLITELDFKGTEQFFESLVEDGDTLNKEMKRNPVSQSSINDVIPRNLPFDYIKVTKSHEKLYLEEFYNDFANIILPFSSYDESLQDYFNPARDIILKCASNESFLLAAILAQGAKTSFQKNSLPEDEEAYCNYLSKCLKLLGPALNTNHDKRDKNNLTSNIEAVLLTVLLLTSANASNTKQDWRPHLRGAKDLLLKQTSNKIRDSKILIFCKFWFISFEILAGVSSKIGGTLKSDSEIDSLMTGGDEYEIKVLKELGIIDKKGFNIMAGYHNDCVSHLRDLIKILNKIRNQGTEFVPNDTFEYLRLLSEFYKQTQIEFINKECILSPEDFKDGIVPLHSLLDTIVIKNEKIIVSWMDTSHQAYVLASIITILTRCFQMTYDSPQVQEITNKLMSLISFLTRAPDTPQSMIKCSMMMIQWPMLIAGMNCIKEEYKYLLMKFFRISAQIGSGSAGFALRKVSKAWEFHKKGTKSFSDSEDEENLDLVSY